MATKRRPRQNSAEYQMVRSLDKLAAFEDYCEGVLPLLRQAIKEGWTREQIDQHPKIQALMAARQITIAIQDPDSSKALAAIRDHRDRTQGKPKEKIELENKYSKLKDEELDSLLLSSLAEDDDDTDSAH
jgi:hypothetical protein